MSEVHPQAVCPAGVLGPRARVDAFAVVAPDARMEVDSHVGSHATVGAAARIGERAQVGAGARLGDGTVLDADSRIGSNAVLAPGVRVGRGGVVEPGAYVVADVPATAIVRGNPAVITGYARAARDTAGGRDRQAATGPSDLASGCRLLSLPRFQDLRGSLVALEFDRDLPFVPVRSFTVFDVPSEEVRGEHAHRWCSQVLIAAHGALSVVVDDGRESAEIRLQGPAEGLMIPPGVWGVQYRFSREAVLWVFASHPYDPEDYIRDYEEFLEFVGSSSQSDTTASG